MNRFVYCTAALLLAAPLTAHAQTTPAPAPMAAPAAKPAPKAKPATMAKAKPAPRRMAAARPRDGGAAAVDALNEQSLNRAKGGQ